MADDKSSSGAWGSGIVVAGIAAVSALYVAFQHPPLVSTRPQEAAYQGHHIAAAQDIDARLWQDPFDAVARDIAPGGDHSSQPANSDLKDSQSVLHGRPDDLAIVVTLSGAPYPEVAETRRRLRYAVLEAMHFRRFMPADEKHIGYFDSNETPFVPSADDTDHTLTAAADRTSAEPVAWRSGIGTLRTVCPGARLPNTIPFEQFENPTEESGPRVLLLWLDEDFLDSARTPIASLKWLRCVMAKGGYDRFTVLGPQDSTTLKIMAREITPRQGSPTPGPHVTLSANDGAADPSEEVCIDPYSIYNFAATAEEKKISDKSLRDMFCRVGLRYHRTVTTDNELALMLACELMRRDEKLNVDPIGCVKPPPRKTPPSHVVLISDWDTVYGSDLVDTVRHVFEKSEEKTKPSSVVVTTYLRGLDGRLPNRKNPKRKAASKDGNAAEQNPDEQTGDKPPNVATPENVSQFESAEGESQYDYLRRLAADLKERDGEFRRTDGSHIAAIGVLGSDVYDKLLILQALRPEFPDANFFTTDLDALLLPDKKSHYTRNLIVASSYGLRLDPSLECGIPSFRTSYQASIFVAATQALHKAFLQREESMCKWNIAINGGWPEPSLFQIGRTGPQPLPTVPVVAVDNIHLVPLSWVTTLNAVINTGWPEPPYQIGRTNLQPWPAARVISGPEEPLDVGLMTLSRVQAADIGIVPVSWGTRLGVFATPLLLIGWVFSFRRVRNDFFTRIGRTNRASQWRSLGRATAGSVPVIALSLWIWFAFGWEPAAQWLTENGLGDPISLFEGVSIWPSVALRAFGFLLALFLIWYTLHALEANRRETLEKFGEIPSTTRLRDVWKDEFDKQHHQWWATIRACFWLRRLPDAAIRQMDHDRGTLKAVGEIATDVSSHWIVRCLRAFFPTLLTFISLLVWFEWLRPDSVPFIPNRGSLSRSVYETVSALDFFGTLFLIFLVVDATLYSRYFIKWLTFTKTNWRTSTTDYYKQRFQLTHTKDVRDWIDLNYLAERTRCITNLVYLPFIALAILIFARSPLFDDFSLSWSVVIPYAASVSVLIAAVVAYSLTAGKAREVACRQVADRILYAKGKGHEATAEQLEKLLADMQELRTGAFAGWGSQPLVKAVLLPLLTYGGTWLLHLYALPGM